MSLQQRQQSRDILKLARPPKPLKVKVKVIEGVALLEAENGAKAVVPADDVCRLAERLNLIVEGYKC
jgi:hypothetical protein